MKKIGAVKRRKGYKGWWIRWSENGREYRKNFNTQDEANMYRRRKYIALNMDVYGCELLAWDLALEEYLTRYDIRGYAKSSKKEAERVLNRVQECCKFRNVGDINQRSVDTFIQLRQRQATSPHTVNKDISRLRAFINWLKKRGYFTGRIDIELMKAPRTIKKALPNSEIRKLMGHCPDVWRMRILMALCTGLRKSDIESLTVQQIDLDGSQIDSQSQKTGKTYIDRPLPRKMIPELKRYLEALPADTVKLFPGSNKHEAWDKIRTAAELPTVTFQQMRVTFSTLMQKIGSIGAAQNLLEHSSKMVTEQYYTDMELILRWKVDQLPVDEWLK